MIDKEVTWNIGGSSTYNDVTVNMFYEKERGANTGNDNQYPNEWSSTTDVGEKHNGIGLIYASDYGYATSGGTLERTSCFEKAVYNYPTECFEANWLKPNAGLTWTLTTLSSRSADSFILYSKGIIGTYRTDYSFGVLPTAYLTKNVTITSGEGTMEQPYELQLNA